MEHGECTLRIILLLLKVAICMNNIEIAYSSVTKVFFYIKKIVVFFSSYATLIVKKV